MMGETKQVLSSNEPELYKELAPNPYTSRALQIIAEKFPDSSTIDVIRTVILAEPEGIYDRNFKLQSKEQQEEELSKQRDITAEIMIRLTEYCKKHGDDFLLLPHEFLYDCLSVLVFETDDTKEIEQKFAQNQRRGFRLTIVNLIEETSLIEATDKKSSRERSLVLLASTVSAAIVLVLLLYLTQREIRITMQEQEASRNVLSIESQDKSQVLPIRLRIPSINVDAAIEYVGNTSKGEMEIPSTTAKVGWYKLGFLPGERGSAVIAGHLDGRNGETGVFAKLDKLREGDKVYITNGYGATISFVVRESRIYDPGYADEVFNQNDSAHLNLITCDGVWDKSKKSYTKRLVVFADIER